ncbi:MAG: hypothetical protein GXY86_04655 [Firmicutes bacterium]|nr:hypothetical protein [Bacillota bacterium]
MKRIISFGSVLLLVMVLIGANVFGADYFLFDKETNKILFMGKNDSEFSEKIEMIKNPDYIMTTNNPDIYLAIFAPENVEKKKNKKQAEPQKGQLIIFNVATERTEDVVELGYAPFRYIYTKDRSHFYISYKPAPDSETLALLHYDISAKTSRKLEDFAVNVSKFIFSDDETSLYALVPFNKKKKQSGKIVILNPLTLTVANTIPTNNSPHHIYFLSQDKLVLIEADSNNLKSPGYYKIVNHSDFSVIDEKTFRPPYSISNNWDPKTTTLLTIVSRLNKTFILKASPDEFIFHEIDYKLYGYNYDTDTNRLYMLNGEEFRILNYDTNEITVCFTDINLIDIYPYQINILPGSEIAALTCHLGGKLKLIDLTDNSLITKVRYGRPGVKFRKFMSLNAQIGVNIAYENLQYFVLRVGTEDITVFNSSFESPTYIVPPESPLLMFQREEPHSQILLVTQKQIYQINSEDLTLKPILAFNKETQGCFILEDDHRFIILTVEELLIVDSSTFEVKDHLEFYVNPDQEYSRLKENERRYYFIPTL